MKINEHGCALKRIHAAFTHTATYGEITQSFSATSPEQVNFEESGTEGRPEMAFISPRFLPQLSARPFRFTNASTLIFRHQSLHPSDTTHSRPSLCRVVDSKIIALLHQPSLSAKHPPKQPVHVHATTRDPRDPPVDSTAQNSTSQHPSCQHQTRPHSRPHHPSTSPRALRFLAAHRKRIERNHATRATTTTTMMAKMKKLPLHRLITRSRKNLHRSQMR